MNSIGYEQIHVDPKETQIAVRLINWQSLQTAWMSQSVTPAWKLMKTEWSRNHFMPQRSSPLAPEELAVASLQRTHIFDLEVNGWFFSSEFSDDFNFNFDGMENALFTL